MSIFLVLFLMILHLNKILPTSVVYHLFYFQVVHADENHDPMISYFRKTCLFCSQHYLWPINMLIVLKACMYPHMQCFFQSLNQDNHRM